MLDQSWHNALAHYFGTHLYQNVKLCHCPCAFGISQTQGHILWHLCFNLIVDVFIHKLFTFVLHDKDHTAIETQVGLKKFLLATSFKL